MKLLIITQKVDINDDVLGFFHRWIEEFAKHCEKLTVICLQKGEYSLPGNVKVLSLGKETEVSKSKYIFNFYKYIWQERKNYDAVFVHMNPEYVVLGGIFWRLLKRRVALWYIHPKSNIFLKIAVFFTNKIFTATEKSFPFFSSKISVFGHGVDMETFKPIKGIAKEKNSIVYVGRITPIKNLDILIKTFRYILEKTDATLHIIGSADPGYPTYYSDFRKLCIDLEKDGRVFYYGAISNKEMPKWYNKYEVLVNLTQSGSFDKVVLEAMACQTLVISSNICFKDYLPDEFYIRTNDPKVLANSIMLIFALSAQQKNEYYFKMRESVMANHNLFFLIDRIVDYFSKVNK